MKKKKRIRYVSMEVAIIGLLFLSNNVLGALVIGATGTGTTSVSSSTCSADVEGVIPPQLDVNNGDDVRFYYNVSWSDTRPSGSSEATHYFNMTVSYTRITGDQWVELSQHTYGDESGSTSLNITVYGVYEGESFIVIWTASLSSLPCSAFDQMSGDILLI